MEFEILSENVSMLTGDLILNTVDDVLDFIANLCYQTNCDSVIIEKKNLHPDFFDLKTGLAGEMLQKFTMYGIRTGIVGDFSAIDSKSLIDFIYESNRNKKTVFADTAENALKMLK